MTVPDGSLPESRKRLYHAVDALIEPRSQWINNTRVDIQPMYLQLYDAIPGAQGEGNHAARSLPPIWLDASSLLATIDGAVRKWQPVYVHPDRPLLPTVCRLCELTQRSWRPQDCKLMDDHSAQLEGWTVEIDMLLTPQHVKHVAAACPSCGHKTTKRRDSAGEIVRVPALQIVTEQGCTCLICKAHWPPAHYALLARVLGFPAPQGVIE
jgi:hypothetical protein